MMTCDIKRNGVNAICDVFLNKNKKDDSSNDKRNMYVNLICPGPESNRHEIALEGF